MLGRLATLAIAVAALLGPEEGRGQSVAPARARAYDQTFVTHHVGTFGGQSVRYSATVEPTVITDDARRPVARFVSTAYVREGVRDASRRPVIFAFAGGPSGASVAYHLRLYGPRQVIEPATAGGPIRFRDNPDGLLDIADVVMVDPAETGFTRILPAGDRKDFYSVNGDTASIRQFMDRWLTAHGRAESPRYVAGGSYGSVRAVRIGWDSLKTRPIDGIFMTANSLMLQEMVGVIGTVLPIPTYAMVAIQHGKADRRGRTDQQIADETYRFAIDDYLPALSRVQDLTPAARGVMADKLAAITGLPAAEILASDLAITREQFKAGLLRADGRVLTNNYDGRDSRLAGAATSADSDVNAVAIRQYLKTELGVTYGSSGYAMSAPDTDDWDYRGPNGAPRNDWPGMLKEQMEANPHMVVYSANGLYDMQGVFGQARWVLSRTRLPRERLVMREYPGSHGLYSDPPTGSLILKDLRGILSCRSRSIGKEVGTCR